MCLNRTRTILASCLLVSTSACSTLGMRSMQRTFLYQAAPSERLTVANSTISYSLTPSALCDSLDSSRRTWGAFAVAAGIGAGTTGGVTALFSDTTPRAITGSLTLSIAIFSAVSAFLSNDYATSFSNHGCLNMDVSR